MRVSVPLVAALLPLTLIDARATPRAPHLRRFQAEKRGVTAPALAARQVEETNEDAGRDGANTTSVTSTSTSSAVTSSSSSSTSAAALTSATSTTSSFSSSSSTSTVQSSAAPSTTSSSSSSTSTAPASTSVVLVTSTPAASSSSTSPSIVAVTSTLSSAASSSSAAATSTEAATSTVVGKASTQKHSVVTETSTDSASASATSIAADSSSSSGKVGAISKSALIAIIVVASVIGLAALIVFAVRKWKLGKSRRFDDRLKPIDFSPGHDGAHDDFIEKTLYRSASNASADRQRQQFVKDLETDPNYVAGIPEHDFTAAPSHGYGTYDDMYTNDPFAHTQSYPYPEDAITYPPAAAVAHGEYPAYDHPTQDPEGYADLQRGNSVGSGSGSGHGHSNHGHEQYPSQEHGQEHFSQDRFSQDQFAHAQEYAQPAYPQQAYAEAYPDQVYAHDQLATAFPSPDHYIGRPTGGSDGPYAQAATYRGF